MTHRMFSYSLAFVTILFHGIIFPSEPDRRIGRIDEWLLKRYCAQDSTNILQHLSTNNNFPDKEPFITIDDGRISKISLPTKNRPFIIIFNNAGDLINQNPDIFPLYNIANNSAVESENQSNKAINAALAHRIVPIDHCTYVKQNGNSLDIVSVFFNKNALKALKASLTPNPRPKPVEQKKAPKNEDYDLVRRVNRRYLGGTSSSSNDETVSSIKRKIES